VIEPHIVRVIGPHVDGKVFPDEAPGDTRPPYAIYQQIGGPVITTVEGGPSGRQKGRFQVNVWASTRAAASTLSRAIQASMQSDPVVFAEPLGALAADFDRAIKLYGATQDFSISWDD